MSESKPEQLLEHRLKQLKAVKGVSDQDQALASITRRLRLQRRQRVFALTCVAVSTVGALYFLANDAPWIALILGLTAAASAFASRLASTRAADLLQPMGNGSLVEAWRSQTQAELWLVKATWLAVLAFSMLTLWLSFQDIPFTRVAIYWLTTVVLWGYALYQHLVVRPRLVHELTTSLADD